MSVNSNPRESTITVEIVHRDGEVTLAANNGIVVTVQSNDLLVALGTVFAANMASFHDFWWKRASKFDITMKVKPYDYNGQKRNSELSI